MVMELRWKEYRENEINSNKRSEISTRLHKNLIIYRVVRSGDGKIENAAIHPAPLIHLFVYFVQMYVFTVIRWVCIFSFVCT